MPRRSKIYHREPKEWFSCPVYWCSRKFRTQTGRTKHIRSKHNLKKNHDLQIRTRSVSLEIPPAIDLDHQDSDTQADIKMHDDVPSSPPFQPLAEVEAHHDHWQAAEADQATNYHPFINGMT